MEITSTPFIRNDYWGDYNDLSQINNRIDNLESDMDLMNINLSTDIENVSNNLNTYINNQANTTITNNIVVNNINANYAEGNYANFDNTFTNNAYIENLTVNKPVFDITLNTPHMENITVTSGNIYDSNLFNVAVDNITGTIIDSTITDSTIVNATVDGNGVLGNVEINNTVINTANIVNLFIDKSISPIPSSAVLGYDITGKVIPVKATFDVAFPYNANYLFTDDHGTAFAGTAETSVGESGNLITSFAVANEFANVANIVDNKFADMANATNEQYNEYNNSFNEVNNSLNNVNNKIDNDISNLAVSFTTNNLSAENATANNLDVSNITVNKITGTNGQVIGRVDGNVKWVNVIDISDLAIIDAVWPIGVIYTQYPQQRSPQEIFPNTTWEELDYDGAFFRASGGNSEAFIEESGVLNKQNQSIQSHNHNFAWNGEHNHDIIDPGHSHTYLRGDSDSGPIHGSTYSSRWFGYVQTSRETTGISVNSATINISGTTDSTGSDETRPSNFTIRIWKRIA